MIPCTEIYSASEIGNQVSHENTKIRLVILGRQSGIGGDQTGLFGWDMGHTSPRDTGRRTTEKVCQEGELEFLFQSEKYPPQRRGCRVGKGSIPLYSLIFEMGNIFPSLTLRSTYIIMMLCWSLHHTDADYFI